MRAPLAEVKAGFDGASPAARFMSTDQAVVVEHGGALRLLVGAHAAEIATATRARLERDGDPGRDVEVVVSLDEGDPPLLYRRVILPVPLRRDDAAALARVLEHTDTTRLLRPAFTIRTVIEFDGEALS